MMNGSSSGESAAKKSMPDSISAEMKETLRESRSSLGMINDALSRFASAIALRSSVRLLFLPVSTSTNSPTIVEWVRSPLPGPVQ